eukprot:1195421-Prorocentrum_minimum.AAC.1
MSVSSPSSDGGAMSTISGTLIDILASFKLQVLRQLLEGGDLGLGWLFCVMYSVGLALLASAAVVYVAPAAGGSGIPEVMAFLNGVQLPKVNTPWFSPCLATLPLENSILPPILRQWCSCLR